MIKPERPVGALVAPASSSVRIPMQIVFLLEQVVNGLVLGGYYLLLAWACR